MGLFSSIFGGSTKVTQTTQQVTNFNAAVDIANAVDIHTEEIAAVLAQFGDKVTEMTGNTTALLKSLAQENAIDLLSRLQFIELLRLRSKQIGMVAAAFAGWWFFFRKKGRKK